MEDDRILLDLTVHRKFRGMSPFAQRLYLLFRELVRVGIAVAVALVLFRNADLGAAIPLSFGVMWLLVGPWLTRQGPGVSHVLLTESGITIVDEGLRCDWEDVGFHASMGDALVFEPRKGPDTSVTGSRRRRVIPLGGSSRSEVTRLFATRAGKP